MTPHDHVERFLLAAATLAAVAKRADLLTLPAYRAIVDNLLH
jgi:hypothetical protein